MKRTGIFLLVLATLAINVSTVMAEETVEKVIFGEITTESAYAINVSVNNPNKNSTEIELGAYANRAGGTPTYWTAERVRPGNNSVKLYVPKEGPYYVLLETTLNENSLFVSEEVLVQDFWKNSAYPFFVVVALIAIAIGVVIGKKWGYNACYNDVKTEEALRNREKQ